MSLNCREIDRVLEELSLEGSQIQKVLQSSWDVLCLCLYGKKKDGKSGATSLLIALSPQAVRLHATFRAVPKSDRPLRFCELLRAHIRDGYIEEAVQLGSDRIVRLGIRQGAKRYLLYLRLWSNAGNVILTDEDNRILDALRRSPRRGELTGGRYKPEETLDTETVPSKEYALRSFPTEGSYNEQLDAWYAEHAGQSSLEALRSQVKKLWGSRRNRLCAAIESLEHKLENYQNCAQWKRQADLLMSALGQEEKHAKWIEVEDYEHGGTVRISLDPSKGLKENALHFYERYRREKGAVDELEEDLTESRKALEELEKEEADLLTEENPLRLQKALKQKQAVRSKQGAKARPGLCFIRSGWLLLVGRTGKENDELLRRHVRGSDYWLHARDWPGAYVFIKAKAGKSVPLEILLDAGNLALFYSKARNSGDADLYYTQVKHLRRAKNGPVGLVLPTQEKNLRIRLDEKRLRELETSREQC